MKSLVMNSACVATKKRKIIHPFDGTDHAVNQSERNRKTILSNMITSTMPYESQNCSASALKPAPRALNACPEPVAATHRLEASPTKSHTGIPSSQTA